MAVRCPESWGRGVHGWPRSSLPSVLLSLPKWTSTVRTRGRLGTASSRARLRPQRVSWGWTMPPAPRPCLEGQDRAFSRCWDKDVPVTQPCGTEFIPVGGKRQASVQKSPSPNASWDWTDVRPSAPAGVLPSLACGTHGRSLASVAVHAVRHVPLGSVAPESEFSFVNPEPPLALGWGGSCRRGRTWRPLVPVPKAPDPARLPPSGAASRPQLSPTSGAQSQLNTEHLGPGEPAPRLMRPIWGPGSCSALSPPRNAGGTSGGWSPGVAPPSPCLAGLELRLPGVPSLRRGVPCRGGSLFPSGWHSSQSFSWGLPWEQQSFDITGTHGPCREW